MPSEAELLNEDFTPSENVDSIEIIINNLYSEIMVNHGKILKLRRVGQLEKADELQLLNLDLQTELDGMIKSQLAYIRYLKAIGQGGNTKNMGVPQSVKDQKSSLGAIVSLVPKS